MLPDARMSSNHRGRECAVRLTLTILLLLSACRDPVGPPPQPGFTFHGAGVSDTVGTTLVQPVTIELRDEDRRPLAGTRIVVRGRGLTTLGAGYSVESLTLDERGRGEVTVRLGISAGEAWLIAQTSQSELELTDSVSFQVLPGGAVQQVAFPGDTAVGVGSVLTVSLRLADRFGNVRPEVVPNVQFEAIAPNVTVAATGTVTASAVGRSGVEVRTETLVDTAWISVVPEGSLAVVGPDSEPRFRDYPFMGGGGLYVQDLDGDNRRLVAPVVKAPASPSWLPDGSALLLHSLAIVSLTGDSVQLAPGISARDASVSADGQWIYFTGRRDTDADSSTQVWRVREDGSDLEQISPPGVDAYGPSPSPDLTQVAYIDADDWPTRLVVQDLTTGDVRIIAEHRESSSDAGLGAPRWSPAGDWIAFTFPVIWSSRIVCYYTFRCPIPSSSVTVWGSQLKAARPDGSEVRDVACSSCVFLNVYVPGSRAAPAAISWSPDGEWLVSKMFYEDLRLTLVRFETGEMLPLNRSTVSFSMPAWMP